MKKFEFRLEKILQVRSFQEEQAKLELAKCVGTVEMFKNQLREIAQEKITVRKDMGLNNFELQSFLASETYLKNLDAKKEQCLNLLAEAELKAEEARKVYAEAQKKVKVLENLKEKKFAEWKKEYIIQQDNIVDDTVSAKKAREIRSEKNNRQ